MGLLLNTFLCFLEFIIKHVFVFVNTFFVFSCNFFSGCLCRVPGFFSAAEPVQSVRQSLTRCGAVRVSVPGSRLIPAPADPPGGELGRAQAGRVSAENSAKIKKTQKHKKVLTYINVFAILSTQGGINYDCYRNCERTHVYP